MKLSKREKNLLKVLAGAIGLFGYVNFIISPQVLTIRDLESKMKDYEFIMEEDGQAVDRLKELTDEYGRDLKEVETISKGYFTSLEQSTLIILLDSFMKNSDLEITGVEFSEYRTENIGEAELNAISASIPFTGDYESFLGFLKQVRQNPKKILVKNINISNNENGLVSGNVVLDFYSIPPLGAKKLSDGIVKETPSSKLNPFSPFEGYISGILDYLDQGNKDNQPSYNTPAPTTKPSPAPTEPEVNIKKTLLEGFETLDMFFVGNPRDVEGSVTHYTNKIQGNYSTKLQYDFILQRSNSLANAVFDKNKPTITVQPEFISLSVYSYEMSSHQLGMVLRDATGKEYHILLADQIDWVYWKTLEATLPSEITYPAEIQRIYVEGNSLDDKTNGVFLLDNLEAAYRDTLPHSYENPNTANSNPGDSSGDIEYYVKKGDTIFNISKRFYNDYSKRFLIMERNNIKDPNQIKIGQKLLIPRL